MDGFHLAGRELIRLGRWQRKGAPDTFDVDGYVSLLTRIRSDPDQTVYAPRFDREIEEPIANAIAIEPRHTTVITEGNYLLHDEAAGNVFARCSTSAGTSIASTRPGSSD